MTAFRYLLGLLGAAAIWALGQRLSSGFGQLADPFLVLVVYHGLVSRPASAMVGGTAAGLVHDTLSGGIFGQLGLVDTLVAYGCSRLRRHLVWQRRGGIAVVFALMALTQRALLAAVQFLLVADAEMMPPWAVLATVATTGVLGAAVFTVGGRLRARAKRRREARNRKLTLETR